MDSKVAASIYKYRWWLTLLTIGLTIWVFSLGVRRVADFSSNVASLDDTSNGTGAVKPLIFNPSMDIWFGEQDSAVETYYEIENRFLPEDYVMVTFEETEHEFGVFSRESLATISRLTERFLTVPGVRHVRSLTYNPWIRWGNITDENGSEEGLIISDLVEADPMQFSDEQIIERMIAVLGAERVARRIGENRVRAVIGVEAEFTDYIGEPLLLGTILSDSGNTSVIQVQVLRPRIDERKLADVFHGEKEREAAPILFSVEQQRASLRGIEHFLRMEKGLAVPTADHAKLRSWIDSLPDGREKDEIRLDFNDPRKSFMKNSEAVVVRKYFEYDATADGYVDSSEASDVVTASANFKPVPLSSYDFRLGGVPLFERNFEIVGMGDAKFVPLMFLVIIGMLFLVFRNVVGVVLPLSVVFGSILAMMGVGLARGNLLNNLTMMSPNMLTAVGIADAIHLVAAWSILRGDFSNRADLIREVIRRNALPVFLTSVTTAVGFYSLTVSGLVPVRMLGTMAAMGTLCAWALSMSVVPALLSLVPHKKKVQGKASLIASFFTEARSARFVDLVIKGRRGILVTAALLFIVAMVGLSRVEIDSDFRAMFPDDNKTMSEFRWIESRMGGVGDLEIVFSGVSNPGASELTQDEDERFELLEIREAGHEDHPEELKKLDDAEVRELDALRRKRAAWNSSRIGVSTEFLGQLEAFERRLLAEMNDESSELSVITDFLSPLDTLRKMHQVQNENKASYYRVPGELDVMDENRAPSLVYDEWTEEWSYTPPQTGGYLVAQYYLQYENGARPGESLTTSLSADRTQLRVQGRVEQASSLRHLAAFDRIEQLAREEFPLLAASVEQASKEDVEALSKLTISGKSLLFARTTQMFAMGFIYSMSLALFLITLLIGLIFRSFRFALLSLIPNVLPIILPLSIFGLLGIALDGPAILVSSVALGVCVDDTIHFFTKFIRGRRRGLRPREALIQVFTEAGVAMTVTTMVLVIGFSTLLLSDFAPNYQMGALASLMIGLAWFADFIITTAVLSLEREPATALVEPQSSAATR